jgi:hypothetical protein
VVDFEVLGQLICKQDEQKADNAEVPTHLWDLVFQHTLPKDFPPLHPKWRERLDTYRELGVRYWKRCLMRTFWWHVGEQVPNKIQSETASKVGCQDWEFQVEAQWSEFV